MNDGDVGTLPKRKGLKTERKPVALPVKGETHMHNLKICTEAASELTRKTLVSDLKLIESSIASFESKETLKDYQKEDLIENRDMREALIKVIRYLSTPKQCEEIGIEFDPWETADNLVDEEFWETGGR
jgi:hypothetical protein